MSEGVDEVVMKKVAINDVLVDQVIDDKMTVSKVAVNEATASRNTWNEVTTHAELKKVLTTNNEKKADQLFYEALKREPYPIHDHPAEIYDPLSIDDALLTFNHQHNFGDIIGQHKQWFVGVYTGCLIVPLPNIETRHKYLKFHDLHHVLTGYSVGRIGEGKVSAWELGTGSMLRSPLLGTMNLIALSTGLFLDHRAMWQAFLRGSQSHNLYHQSTRQAVDRGDWQSIAELKRDFIEVQPVNLFWGLRRLEYLIYVLSALLIHALVVIPALILRFIFDVSLNKPLIKIITPPRRPDLY